MFVIAYHVKRKTEGRKADFVGFHPLKTFPSCCSHEIDGEKKRFISTKVHRVLDTPGSGAIACQKECLQTRKPNQVVQVFKYSWW